MIKKLIEAYIERYKARTEIKYCKHIWTIHEEMENYTYISKDIPEYTTQTLICQKCGTIKKIEL